MFQNLQIDQELPDIQAVNFQPIEKDYRKLLLIIWSVFAAIAMIGLIILIISKLEALPGLAIVISFVVWSVLFFGLLLYILLSFPRRQYAVREKDISYSSGLVFHSTTTVPFSRIQHIEIGEGALERLFKMATINIYTAGDNGRDLKIKGLTKINAEKIKEFITQSIQDASV